jgi:uncharacterized protein YbaP (TraB family)
MRNSLVLIGLLLCGCGVPDDAVGQPLWEGTLKGKQVSILGTIHSLTLADARQAFPRALARFSECRTLYVERDATSAAALSSSQAFSQGLSTDPTLDTELTVDEWRTLREATQAVIPEPTLKRLKPWYATLLYSSLVTPTVDAEGKPTAGMDLELVDEARKAGLEVRFLEPEASAVIALNDSVTTQDLKELLARPPEALRQSRAELENAWRAGDMAAIEKASARIPQAQREAVLLQRNLSWSFRLERELADVAGPVFVAVGSGHLVYGADRSLLASLRNSAFPFGTPINRVP